MPDPNTTVKEINCRCLFEIDASTIPPLIQGTLKYGEIDILFENGNWVNEIEIEWKEKNPYVSFDSGKLTYLQEKEVNNYLSKNSLEFYRKLNIFIQSNLSSINFTIS